MRVGPIRAKLVTPELADRVVAPAYDLLSAEDRKRILAEEPLSFLHAIRSPDEYETGVDEDRVLADSAAGLDRLLAAGAFADVGAPALFVYRLATGDHVQTGVAGALAVADVTDGAVLPHETTRIDKEHRLTRYLETVRAASSPVSLTYRPNAAIADLVAAVTNRRPEVDTVGDDGLRQQVWAITDVDTVAAVSDAFDRVPASYLIDGHHRVAAALRMAAADPDRSSFFAVLFPADQVRLVAFHRTLRSLPADLVDHAESVLRSRFGVVDVADASDVAPRGPGQVGVILPGRRLRVDLGDTDGLQDADLLQDRILGPMFGVEDPRSDDRLDYVPGISDAQALADRIERDEFSAAFLLHPMSVDEMMAVSDAGLRLPPKSTWFAPKARSGVFLTAV